MKVAENVKLAMQRFENFGGVNAPNSPLVARLSTVQRQELMLPDSSTNSKIQFSLNNCQSRLSNAANLLLKIGFTDFAIANLLMLLVVSISHRRSCIMLYCSLCNEAVQLVLCDGAPVFIPPY